MKVSSALVATATLSAALAAQPRPMSLGAPKHARVSIQPVAVTPTSATLLVTMAVDDGWHVSWRNPGETGLPTRFAWNLPAGVRVRRDTWPVPVVTRSDVGVAHTLEGDVPWLVEFALEAPVAADRLVSLTLRYGICRDVCIPEQQVVQGVLPGTGPGATAQVPMPAALQRRLVRDGAPVAARLGRGSVLCVEQLPPGLAAGTVDLIASPDRDVDAALSAPRPAAGAGGPVRFTLPAGARLGPVADTVLLVAGATGVAVPLDFRAPAPRCRR